MDENPDVDSAVVKRMLRNFKLSDEAEAENRENGLRALKFRRGGKDQWDDGVWEKFGEQNKPRESFNQIPQFTHQVTNDMRINMPQIRFEQGDGGTDEVAEILEDLCRAVQSTTEAEVAYDTAIDSQVTIGWGYWRFITKYANNRTKDKDIAVQWIPNAFNVFDDPNAMMQDFSDRKFLIQVEDVHVDDFNNDYGKKYGDSDLESIGSKAPKWASNDTVRIAEYWEVKTGKKTIYFDENGKLTDEETDDSRDLDDPVVWWYKCTGKEVLESRKWDGIYIPYIRVSGETLYIDGKVFYLGLVDSMIAVQKQFNYFMNSATYMTSLAPIAPFIVDPEQIEGYQKFWDKLNTEPYPYLPARMFKNGQQFPYPQRVNSGVELAPMMTLLQQAQQNFYNVTGIYPASLGQESNEKSGKAILARQKEGDVSTFHFQDNNARALRFGGRVFEDLARKTYDGARTLQLLKEDLTAYQKDVNQPITDELGTEKFIDLSKGEYSVSVTTGPSYGTRRQAGQDQAQQLIQSFPQVLQTPAGPPLIRSMDLVDADMIADGIEKALPPQFQTPPELKDIPPQIQTLIMQGKQQIEQLGQQLQQAQQIIQQGAQEMQALQSELKNKQADAQAKITDSQAKTADAQRKYQADMATFQLKQQELNLKQQELAQNLLMQEADIALKNRQIDYQYAALGINVASQQSDNEQEVITAAMDQNHQFGLQAVSQAHDLNMANNDAANQAMLAAHKVAITPPPVTNPPDTKGNSAA